MKKGLLIFSLLILFVFGDQGFAQQRFLIKVSAFTREEIKLLSSSGIKAYAKTADFYLAEATTQSLDYLKNSGIPYQILDDDPEFSLYYFVWAKPGEDISKYLEQLKEKATVLETEGERAIIKGRPGKVAELGPEGFSVKFIRKTSLPTETEQELPAVSKILVPAYDLVIDSIISKVTTSELSGLVGDLSGVNQVNIGGSPYTLATRYTYADGCDKAAQYIKEKFESYGLTAWYDTFRISDFTFYIMDIVSTPDGNTAWLGGLFGGIWKTTDAGNYWYKINGTDDYDLWVLSAPVPDTLYGAGNTGVIIKSTDAGETWFQLSSPTPQRLRGAYFETSQSGWVAGEGGTIFFTTDGGQTWINQSTGSASLYEITFTDSNNGWVVGSGGTILHTTNGGSNWVLQNSGTTGIITGVDFATPAKGWVCGESGYLRYTTDGGTNWISQNSRTTQTLNSVSAPDSFHVWVAGMGGTILHTTNAGSNWSLQSSYNYYGEFYEAYFLDSLTGWVCGHNDLLHTTNAGAAWTQKADPLIPAYIKYNVVAELPGMTDPGKECLITAHYDDRSENPFVTAPGADDNGSGTATVMCAADILRNYDFNYTLKFICFSGEEQGLMGSEAYAAKAKFRGDAIVGVYNLDMLAWESNGDNVMELHSGTGGSSQGLADIAIGVINNYGLALTPQKITSGASTASDHASFWAQGYPAIMGIEDFQDFTPYYHRTTDRLSTLDLPYYTDFAKAGIASVAILAQPYLTYIYGDANGDTKISVSDAVYLINYLFKGGPEPAPLASGDANCDGQVTVSDVIHLINYLFKGGPLPGC